MVGTIILLGRRINSRDANIFEGSVSLGVWLALIYSPIVLLWARLVFGSILPNDPWSPISWFLAIVVGVVYFALLIVLGIGGSLEYVLEAVMALFGEDS
jgi:hypothetical protein